MLNLTPGSTNNVIIYADTVTSSVGNEFLLIFTNSYSRETFAVVPNVVRRNARFVELSFDTVTVQQYSDPLQAEVYLYPTGNFDYIAFNTDSATINYLSSLQLFVWKTEEEFWSYFDLFDSEEIDRGQAFLYTSNVCDTEIEFIPYVSDNEGLFNVVYVTSIPMANFPCIILNGQTFTVETNTITYCDPILIENGGIVIINDNIFLKQIPSPYEPC